MQLNQPGHAGTSLLTRFQLNAIISLTNLYLKKHTPQVTIRVNAILPDFAKESTLIQTLKKI